MAKTVGKDIGLKEIKEFYYTYDASTYPPQYQRYRFFTSQGKYYFYHEKREGDHWPLTEADATMTGTIELSEEEWDTFYGHLKDGTVVDRTESLDCGNAGPWLYLYWSGDHGKTQAFTFQPYGKRTGFEEFCAALQKSNRPAADPGLAAKLKDAVK